MIHDTKRISVLLIDDELDYLEILKKRLSKRGFEVQTAGSGAEGIRILRGREFDVSVVDLKMEDMDGIEVLGVFKKMDPELPVIMLTGHGSEEAAREGMAIGAFDYLNKPCDLETLLERIVAAAESGAGSS